MRYEIYLEGCTKPVWTYTYYRWVEKRFQSLADLNSITHCTLKMVRNGKVFRVVGVWFGKDVMGNRIWEV